MTRPLPAIALAAVVAVGAGTGSSAALAAGGADHTAAQRAASWLARTPLAAPGGQVADTIVALRAAGRSRAAGAPGLRRLRQVAPAYATTAGAAAKVTLAAVAAGADPTRFGGRDYVRGINARYAGGRYGATLFEHAYALLALRAAQRPIPRSAITTALAARRDGGWGLSFDGAGRDSVDATGLMIEALRAAGVPASNAQLRAGAGWMLAQRNGQGGYASAGAGGATEANPTANVLRALRALGRPAPANTRATLRRLQERSGAVRFTAPAPGSRLMATNDALIAFADRTLPVR